MKRVHIQLTEKKLDDVVDEMAMAAARSLEHELSVDHTFLVRPIKRSIRMVLENYVHAYDTCGLATICQEAGEVDPWSPEG